MNVDLDRLRQELDDRLAAAPQEPLITPALIQKTIQTPRPRRRVWLVPASIAASVALVIGVGIRMIHKDGELPSMPQPVEVAQVETPREHMSKLPVAVCSPVQGGRASSPDLAGKMPAIRGQAGSLPSQPSSPALEIVQIDDEATFRACVEAQIIQAASLINV